MAQKIKRKTKKKTRAKPNTVYAVHDGTNTKIGCSSNVFKRLISLQVGCATPMVLIATMPGGTGRERHIQRKLKAKRMRGEWFCLGEISEAQALLREHGMEPCLHRGPWAQSRCENCGSFEFVFRVWSYGCAQCPGTHGVSPQDLDLSVREHRQFACVANYDLAALWMKENEEELATKFRQTRFVPWGTGVLSDKEATWATLRSMLKSRWIPYATASGLWAAAGRDLVTLHNRFWLDAEILWVDAYTEMYGPDTFRTKDKAALMRFEQACRDTATPEMPFYFHYGVTERGGWWQIRID